MEMPSFSKSDEDSKLILVKEAVKSFIEQGVQSAKDVEEINKCLDKLYYSDMLITNEVYEWAKERMSTHVLNVSESPEISEEKTTPLFCEDTIYHASLCCYAVCTRNASDYQEFFCKFGHHFEELSISNSDSVERYLLARKEKTYFVAFLGKPSFLQWKEEQSVQHGE